MMMNALQDNEVRSRLLSILIELERQREVASSYSPGSLPYVDEMRQLREYIELAGEYAIAYESIVATVETHPFRLSGTAAVKLLEVALSMGYKTDRPEDASFDIRT